MWIGPRRNTTTARALSQLSIGPRNNLLIESFPLQRLLGPHNSLLIESSPLQHLIGPRVSLLIERFSPQHLLDPRVSLLIESPPLRRLISLRISFLIKSPPIQSLIGPAHRLSSKLETHPRLERQSPLPLHRTQEGPSSRSRRRALVFLQNSRDHRTASSLSGRHLDSQALPTIKTVIIPLRHRHQLSRVDQK